MCKTRKLKRSLAVATKILGLAPLHHLPRVYNMRPKSSIRGTSKKLFSRLTQKWRNVATQFSVFVNQLPLYFLEAKLTRDETRHSHNLILQSECKHIFLDEPYVSIIIVIFVCSEINPFTLLTLSFERNIIHQRRHSFPHSSSFTKSIFHQRRLRVPTSLNIYKILKTFLSTVDLFRPKFVKKTFPIFERSFPPLQPVSRYQITGDAKMTRA